MALWLFEQENVVRHLGYPLQGLAQNAPAGGSLAYGNAGYRFFESYGPLLYRLTQLAPSEESRIVGASFGSIGFTGLLPQVGDSCTVTITSAALGGSLSKTVTVPSVPAGASPWNLLTASASLASLFAVDPLFNSAGFQAVANYGAGPYTNAQLPNPIVSIRAPMCQTFTMTVSNTGLLAGQIISPPTQRLSPYLNFTRAGVNNIIYGYLPILDYLDGAVGGATIDMSVMVANNVTMRMDEIDQRENLYQRYRKQFAQWLCVPLGDDLPLGGDGGPKNLRSRCEL